MGLGDTTRRRVPPHAAYVIKGFLVRTTNDEKSAGNLNDSAEVTMFKSMTDDTYVDRREKGQQWRTKLTKLFSSHHLFFFQIMLREEIWW